MQRMEDPRRPKSCVECTLHRASRDEQWTMGEPSEHHLEMLTWETVNVTVLYNISVFYFTCNHQQWLHVK